jgi:hypothetical protein
MERTGNHRYQIHGQVLAAVLSLLSTPRIRLASPGLTLIHIEVDMGAASCPPRI